MKTSRAFGIKLILLSGITLLMFISLLTFNQGDIRFLTSHPNLSKENTAGFVGAYLAWGAFFLMGLGAYLIPFFIILWVIISFLEEEPRKLRLRIFGAIFSILAVSSIFSLGGPEDLIHRFQRGGIIGLAFSNFLLKYLGQAGTLIIITILLILSFLITADFLVFSFVGWLRGRFKALIKGIRSIPSDIIKRKEIARREASHLQEERFTTTVKVRSPEEPKKIEAIKERAVKVKERAPLVKAEEKIAQGQEKPLLYGSPYKLPSSELLKFPPPIEEREIKEDLEENSRILEETLSDFDIGAKVVGVSKGPVITRYELEPASGVKIHRITSLSDNIALAMKAVSIRVVAPIPGKGTIGVEVPNLKSAVVYLKEILESKEYEDSPSKLKLALGKDISGAPIIADLDAMPHLLIAGATGSGKTVCVNSIITALLYNASPDELKFLMVDPKRVELAVFNDLPHLLTPVVTEPKKVSHALNWAVNEMERRYELFAGLGVRNIDGYNKKTCLSQGFGAQAKSDNSLPILPYIVVIIDELADLMLVSQQELEDMIMRLAQLSRAVGIHMIIATQRPSVDVITGVIKANFPARISFKVASKVDSRTVIDANGAEKLLGRGDMLFIQPGSPKPIRGQGSLVSDDEIGKITNFIKSQRKPVFEEEIFEDKDKPTYKKFEKDEVYEEAVRLVLQTKQASVSMLQRRLGVGYTRAARLIDMMEDERVVGPYQGSKPREILIDNIEEKSRDK